MKLCFETNGVGRNFESIRCTNSALAFCEDFNVPYEDYGIDLRVQKNYVIDITELKTIADMNIFVQKYYGEIKLTGCMDIAKIEFRTRHEDDEPQYYVWDYRYHSVEDLLKIINSEQNKLDLKYSTQLHEKITVLGDTIQWKEM